MRSFINKLTWYPWILILFLFEFGPFDFGHIQLKVYFFIFLILLFFSFGFNLFPFKKNKKLIEEFERGRVKKIFIITIFFSVLYFLSAIYKFSSYEDLTSLFSLEDFSSLRAQQSYDISIGYIEKGSSLVGNISNILSGFPFFAIFILIVYFSSFTKFERLILILISIFGILSTFLTGGRFGFVIAIFIVFLLFKIYYQQNPFKNLFKLNFLNIFLLVLLLFLIQVIFNLTILRLNDWHIFNDSAYVIESFSGFNLNVDKFQWSIIQNLFSFEYQIIFGLFIYYLTHAIYQLDFLLINLNFLTSDWPFYGAYQFYPFVLFLNKFLSFEIISIDQILSQLPQSGVYLTGVGSSYIDFGLFGSIFFFFILGVLLNIFVNYHASYRSLSNLYIIILICLILVFLPVIGIIGTSVYPSLLSIYFFLRIIDVFVKLPKV